jgi:hypothetical protein
LDHLFKSFGGKNKKPGERQYIMADEFDQMWQYSGLVSDDFGPRDAYINFNASMMSQIDELESDRHVKASFVEFIEMFSRCCDKISFPPIHPTDGKKKTGLKEKEEPPKEEVEEE